MKPNWLHVELTSRCNAWCPSCTRNNYGFGLSDFVIQDLSVQRLQEITETHSINSLQLCGNYGDPITAGNLTDHLEFIGTKEWMNVQIHTNGSMRKPEWWTALGETLSKPHEVIFALDGIQEIHERYRQGTSYNRIIQNASAFMAAGGNAVWQFIPFKHNEHQIKDCIRLSQKLGFSRFEFVNNARYNEKSFHYITGEPIDIQGWKHDDDFSTRHKEKSVVHEEDCMHLVAPSMYLSATGKLSPCCYLSRLDMTDFKGTSYRECFKNCGK